MTFRGAGANSILTPQFSVSSNYNLDLVYLDSTSDELIIRFGCSH